MSVNTTLKFFFLEIIFQWKYKWKYRGIPPIKKPPETSDKKLEARI